MTSPLRKKRPTTVPARNIPARTPAKALALAALLLGAGLAPAQQSPYGAVPTASARPRSAVLPPWQAAAPIAPPLVRTAYQQPMPVPGGARPADDQLTEQRIQLEPPGPDRLFQLESEDALKERMRQEALQRVPAERIVFPDEPILSRDTYLGRNWSQRTLYVEPNYLCYKRLYFEQKNSERYGWDLGPVSTALAPAKFFADVVTLPYHWASDPFRHCECSAGYCLPGDSVPLLLYPPELSASGAVAQTASVLALLAIFP